MSRPQTWGWRTGNNMCCMKLKSDSIWLVKRHKHQVTCRVVAQLRNITFLCLQLNIDKLIYMKVCGVKMDPDLFLRTSFNSFTRHSAFCHCLRSINTVTMEIRAITVPFPFVFTSPPSSCLNFCWMKHIKLIKGFPWTQRTRSEQMSPHFYTSRVLQFGYN